MGSHQAAHKRCKSRSAPLLCAANLLSHIHVDPLAASCDSAREPSLAEDWVPVPAEVWSVRRAVAVWDDLADEVHSNLAAAVAVEPYRGECLYFHFFPAVLVFPIHHRQYQHARIC